MKILSIAELLCLIRFELEEMQRHLTLQITDLAPGSVELSDTLATLANIRLVLARPGLRHGRHGPADPTP